MTSFKRILSLFVVGWLMLSACGVLFGPASPTAPPVSPTPAAPTFTPEPLAASVNGRPITQAEYEAELSRYESAQQAAGIDLATIEGYQSQVLDTLVDRELLVYGAELSGFSVDESSLQTRIDQLANEVGGMDNLMTWVESNGYTLDTFEHSLRAEMLAAMMVELLTDQIPSTNEHIHARHILVADRTTAEQLLEQLNNGADFALLAVQYSIDPSTRPDGGDLGWFPHGYLLIPEVETVAFRLQPGEISDIVESALGFHIVQTLEREIRPLSPDARSALRHSIVEEWLETQRQEADIEIFITP
jgi:parvulin-like peptidyl-prolyl isomerase